MRRLLLPVAYVVLGFSPVAAQIGGQPGAFSRMGFGARGMALGNAMTAVTSGDIVGYYNPALIPLAATRNASASAGILSLDRKLNFIHYTQPLKPTAGVSAGIISGGVSNIDGRDLDGESTGPLRTSENQIFMGFGTRLARGLTVGLNFKLYYYHLYTDLASTTVGVDLGALYAVTPALMVGVTVRDINSRYKWDTSDLYGSSGNSTIDEFPLLYTVGGALQLPDSIGLVSVDVEFSNARTIIVRAGAEVPVIPELSVRAGFDRIDLKQKGAGVRPAFGFTVQKDFGGWTPAVHYAYIMEPFAPSGMHMISLAVIF